VRSADTFLCAPATGCRPLCRWQPVTKGLPCRACARPIGSVHSWRPPPAEGDVMRRSLRFKLVGVVAIVLAGTVSPRPNLGRGPEPPETTCPRLTGPTCPRRAWSETCAWRGQLPRCSARLSHGAGPEHQDGDAAADLTRHRGQVGDAFDGLTALALTPDVAGQSRDRKAGWLAYLADTANLTTTSGTAELIALQSGSPATKYAALDADLLGMSESLSAGADLVASDANSLMGFLPVLMVLGLRPGSARRRWPGLVPLGRDRKGHRRGRIHAHVSGRARHDEPRVGAGGLCRE
jgi:hypothetical protein